MVINCNVCGRPVALIDHDQPAKAEANIFRRALSGFGVDLEPATLVKLLDPATLVTMFNFRCVHHG